MTAYANGFISSSSAPASADVDDVWYDKTNEVWRRWNGTVWTLPSGFALAQQYYNPAGDTVYSTTSTTHADVDATNAAITFTAPSTGNVLITAQFYVGLGLGTSLDVSLRESAALVSGTSKRALYTASNGAQAQVFVRWKITGLTQGSSHTYTLGYARSGGTAAAEIHAGSTLGAGLSILCQVI